MRRRIDAGITVVAALVLLGSYVPPLCGQAVASAQIAGYVTDPSGAGVPNAAITATQVDTGQVRTTVSGSDRSYALPDLPVGPYKLEALVSGFQAYFKPESFFR